MLTGLSSSMVAGWGGGVPANKPVTILGSENCQSISFQNLLSGSQPFHGL